MFENAADFLCVTGLWLRDDRSMRCAGDPITQCRSMRHSAIWVRAERLMAAHYGKARYLRATPAGMELSDDVAAAESVTG